MGANGGALIFGDFCVIRYKADGTLDISFGTGGKLAIDFGESEGASDIALQADGKIVLAGGSGKLAGNILLSSSFALVRLNAAGSPDASFDGDGKATAPRLHPKQSLRL